LTIIRINVFTKIHKTFRVGKRWVAYSPCSTALGGDNPLAF
jgi:hypothetical protein